MREARLVVSAGPTTHVIDVEAAGEGRFRVRLDGEPVEVDARLPASGPYSLLVSGMSYLVDVSEEGDGLVVSVDGQSHRLRLEDPRRRARGDARAAPVGQQRLVAPMPGKVVAVHVEPGRRVEPGAPLVVLEAMKMENELRATAGGVVAEVSVTVGQAVKAGDVLVVVRPEAP